MGAVHDQTDGTVPRQTDELPRQTDETGATTLEVTRPVHREVPRYGLTARGATTWRVTKGIL